MSALALHSTTLFQDEFSLKLKTLLLYTSSLFFASVFHNLLSVKKLSIDIATSVCYYYRIKEENMANSDFNLFDDEPILKSSEPVKPTEKVGLFKGIKLKWEQHKEKVKQKKNDKADEFFDSGVYFMNQNQHEYAIPKFEKAEKLYIKTQNQERVNLCKKNIEACKKTLFEKYFSIARQTNLDGVKTYKEKRYDAAFNTFVSAQSTLEKAHKYGQTDESYKLSQTIERNRQNAWYWKNQVIANDYYNKAVAKRNAGVEKYNVGHFFSALDLFKEARNLANQGISYDNTSDCANLHSDIKDDIDDTEKQIAQDYTNKAVESYNCGVRYKDNGKMNDAAREFKEAYDFMCKACNYYPTTESKEFRNNCNEAYEYAYYYENDQKVERAFYAAYEEYKEAAHLYNTGCYHSASVYARSALETLEKVRRLDRKDVTDDLWDKLTELDRIAWREYMYEDDGNEQEDE